MASSFFPGRANELSKFLKIFLTLNLIALTVVECSLSTVLQSTGPSSTLLTKGAIGPVNIGNDRIPLNTIRLPAPQMAKKSSDLSLSSSLTPKLQPLKSSSDASEEANKAIALLQPDNRQGDNLLQKLSGMVRNVIAPAKSYIELVQRYHKWFFNYKKLRSMSQRQLKEPNEILKEEYSKVDELLVEQEAAKHAADHRASNEGDEQVSGSNDDDEATNVEPTKPMDPKKVENMDFVFKALRIVIDRLEARLEEMEKRENIPIDEDSVTAAEAEPNPKNDERIQAAMERVRRTVMSSAKNLLTGEAAIIARTAVFHGIAQYMDAKPDTGDALDQLRPIVFMLGSASTPVAVSYLMGLEFRAALAVVDRANPLSLFGINLKKKEEEAPAMAQ